jgi:hypothetical protein
MRGDRRSISRSDHAAAMWGGVSTSGSTFSPSLLSIIIVLNIEPVIKVIYPVNLNTYTLMSAKKTHWTVIMNDTIRCAIPVECFHLVSISTSPSLQNVTIRNDVWQGTPFQSLSLDSF